VDVSGYCASSSGKSVASFASKAERRLCCLLWLEGERFELVVPWVRPRLMFVRRCLHPVPGDRCLLRLKSKPWCDGVLPDLCLQKGQRLGACPTVFLL
jgi:hypothetical protein